MPYAIKIIPAAVEDLDSITDNRIRDFVDRRIDRLADNPEKQGVQISGRPGYRRVKVSGYRVIYRVNRTSQTVEVILIDRRRDGDRRDVYNVFRRRGY